MTETSGTHAAGLFARHQATLDQALEALQTRAYFSAYPESPSPRIYGEDAAPSGKAAFEAWLGTEFPLQTPGATGTVATERSPYGFDLGVRYPRVTVEGIDELLAAAQAGMREWRDAGPEGRTGVCMEILHRLHQRVFEIANAVQHTSGQAFVMAFQAGGPHALDRGLESVAAAFVEMTRMPTAAIWEKPTKGEPLRMEKRSYVVPRGIAMVIGCNTFPTWNSWPGFFASLVTGNPVIVKPHPGAVLPLAITVQVAQEVLGESGFDPNLVTLAAENPDDKVAAVLALRSEIQLIDYTGSSAFGEWLEQNASQAQVFAEKSGVNTVVIDSTDDFKGMCNNLAYTLSLYSGQMCTTSQNIYIPRDGINTDQGHKSFDEVAAGITGAMEKLLGDDARAVALLGAIVNTGVLGRLELAPSWGEVLLPSRTIKHPEYPEATVRTPTIVAIDAGDESVYTTECFGPVSFLIRTDATEQSIELLRRTVKERGAMTASVYSTSAEVLAAAEDAALDAGVALSENLTDGVYVNQTAAFSDLHGTGANPAANAAYTDAAYVADRFRVVQVRRHI